MLLAKQTSKTAKIQTMGIAILPQFVLVKPTIKKLTRHNSPTYFPKTRPLIRIV